MAPRASMPQEDFACRVALEFRRQRDPVAWNEVCSTWARLTGDMGVVASNSTATRMRGWTGLCRVRRVEDGGYEIRGVLREGEARSYPGRIFPRNHIRALLRVGASGRSVGPPPRIAIVRLTRAS
jgi:hypothetical protein